MSGIRDQFSLTRACFAVSKKLFMSRSRNRTAKISRPISPRIAPTNRTFLRSPLALVLAVVCGVFLIEMVFAFYTQDAWEDFYITFRASRNLAMGHGLVFNPGERVHSFTSPLHTLLLAGLSVLTGNGSEQPVLWLSRILLSGVLAWAVLILLRVCRQAGFALAATAFLALFLMIDAKTVDFTINGMEVPLMIFFLALAMFAHIQSGRSTNWRLLGIAWAGLEWTRPDGVVYGGLLAAGFLLFPVARSATARKDTVVLYGKALALSIVLICRGSWAVALLRLTHPAPAYCPLWFRAQSELAVLTGMEGAVCNPHVGRHVRSHRQHGFPGMVLADQCSL